LRALPDEWLSRNLYAIPLALVINSLVWGTALYALWQSLRRVPAAVACPLRLRGVGADSAAHKES
jgi:hypothetical protein